MARQDFDQYLDDKQIPHQWIPHPPAYTAQEIAATAHVRGRSFAKTVIVRLNGKLAMAVIPANERVVPESLGQMVGVEDVRLADEREFEEHFPDCELGAMPPFGSLYNMPVFVADTLAHEQEIIFNAGSHEDCIKLSLEDYKKLEHPRVGHFTEMQH